MKTKVVRDLTDPELQFVSNSQDVTPINREFRRKFDSYFVSIEDGDYAKVYGMEGIVPHLNREVTVIRE